MLRACRSLRRKGGRGRVSRISLIRAVVALLIGKSIAHVAPLVAQTIPPVRILLPTLPADSFVTPLIGAGFRFVATVRTHRAVTAAHGYTSAYETNVVVDTVFRAPSAVGDLRGKTLTILSSDTSVLRSKPAVFIASGVEFGETIVLRAQAHVPLDSVRQGAIVGGLISRGDSLLRIYSIRRHGATGDVRFLGTVQTINDSTSIAPHVVRRGEHDPRWREAQVRVDKPYGPGVTSGSIVRVLFPGSRDAAYLYSPRLEASARSIFIAQNANKLLRDTSNTSLTKAMYFVVRPQDVLPGRDSTIMLLPVLPP